MFSLANEVRESPPERILRLPILLVCPWVSVLLGFVPREFIFGMDSSCAMFLVCIYLCNGVGSVSVACVSIDSEPLERAAHGVSSMLITHQRRKPGSSRRFFLRSVDYSSMSKLQNSAKAFNAIGRMRQSCKKGKGKPLRIDSQRSKDIKKATEVSPAASVYAVCCVCGHWSGCQPMDWECGRKGAPVFPRWQTRREGREYFVCLFV